MSNFSGRLYDSFLAKLQPPRMELSMQYQRLLGDCETLYDVGCGAGNHLAELVSSPTKIWIGVDSHQGSLDVASKRGIYQEVICSDILDFLTSCPDNAVDAVLASCVIEHMPKEVGHLLLTEMKRVCRVQAIVFTPNGFVPQPADPDNPANEHVSGWSLADLKRNGFEIDSGLYGHRRLRTSFGLPSLRPVMLGDLIAKITSRPAFRFPSIAYQFVAVYVKK